MMVSKSLPSLYSLDMQVTPGLVEKCHDCFILKDYGMEKNLSDHCPVGLVVKA